jgi:hypothetical protein
MRRRARLLANIYNWLTVGFDTWHLKEAKALLNQLASQAVVEESREWPKNATGANHSGC